jgi:glyoxylase-like metal-dependent hydrolase (beta-lactamase superfamily II)
MEIFPGVHQIASVFAGRPLYQYLFAGERLVLLLDSGVAETPASVIFPYLEAIGLSPQKISLAVAMHADIDHHGGLPAIKDACPATLLACHAADRAMIEDPDLLYRQRYNFLAADHGLGFGREAMALCPEGRRVDVVLAAEDELEVSPGWKLQVWHVPGHSEGHLAVYDPRRRAAFSSDAVQGSGYPSVSGGMAFGPTYYAVSAYLATIDFLNNQPIEHLYSGHWPPLHGRQVGAFLEESRSFVEKTEARVLACLKDHPGGVTLQQILGQIAPLLGDWPRAADQFLQFALYGHLRRLCDAGIIQADQIRPRRWRLA